MSKEENKIELQQMQQPMQIQTPVFDRQSIWYTNRPIDWRTQTRNRYLDYTAVSWLANIEGKAVWSAIDFNILPLDTVLEKTGNLKFNFTASWWLEIPVDWSYIMSFINVFLIVSNTSWKTASDIIAQYWLSSLIPSVTFAEYEWWPRSPLYYDALPFYSDVAVRNVTFNIKATKWTVIYVCADHRWNWVTFPVNWWIYITKIS